MNYTWGWMLNLSWGVLHPGAQLTSCSGLQHRVWPEINWVASKGVWPSWATNCSTPQAVKSLLWGHRSVPAKCCHCILAAEFVFHLGWRDIKDAIALAFFRLLHLLWENGKNRNWRGGRIPCHVVLLHKETWLTKLSTWRFIIALCGHSFYNVFLN